MPGQKNHSAFTSGPATVWPISTPELFQSAVLAAVRLLTEGQIVALPTETVYGLAANAWNQEAVERIFQAKGRSAKNPLIVHVNGFSMTRACVASWPERASSLARSFWPGPLALVLPKSERIPPAVTGGGATVAVRWPSHPFAQAVIEACGFPLAAPSANRTNEISPTTAEHVLLGLGDLIPMIVDAGSCSVGIESTVLDLCVDPPAILRPGIIPASALGASRTTIAIDFAAGVPRSPGLLSKHYAPRAKLVLFTWRNTVELEKWVASQFPEAHRVHVIAHETIPISEHFARISVIPHDAEAYARAIYAELHTCDQEGADLIVVESPPQTEAWAGIRDRLRRAAGSPPS